MWTGQNSVRYGQLRLRELRKRVQLPHVNRLKLHPKQYPKSKPIQYPALHPQLLQHI